MTKEEFFTREVVVECSEYDKGSAPYIRVVVKCKYNPVKTDDRWPFLGPQSPSMDIFSITSEEDISGLISDDAFEEIYGKALDKMMDLMDTDGIPEGKFIHVEADE